MGRLPEMKELLARTQDRDDFSVIYTSHGDEELGDVLNRDYYGFAAEIEPGMFLNEGQDFPYLMRGLYYIIVERESEVAGVLDRTGVDVFMRKTLWPEATLGRLRLYSIGLNEEVLKSYREAAADARAEPALRAQALVGLGFLALKTERYSDAVAALAQAELLAPGDRKAHYLAGMARYLSFDDAGAANDFEWVVAHDTANVHAPLYLANVLAGLGREDEARRWYGRYYEAERPAASWSFRARALRRRGHRPGTGQGRAGPQRSRGMAGRGAGVLLPGVRGAGRRRVVPGADPGADAQARDPAGQSARVTASIRAVDGADPQEPGEGGRRRVPARAGPAAGA
ncbi:MAG: hypothetical protein HY077_00880 [Elusimicrobia bacterium]|nr:hypothetical protein [Elusimicrobiota bacterium]